MHSREFRTVLVVIGLGVCSGLYAQDHCCEVVSKNLVTNSVAVRIADTGETYEIPVTNPWLFKQLQPGVTFGPDTISGIAVPAEALMPNWAVICCISAPTETAGVDGMNKSDIAAPLNHELSTSVELRVLSLERVSSRAVKLEFSVHNKSDQQQNVIRLGIGRERSLIFDLATLALVDYEGGMRYGVITDEQGACACTRGNHNHVPFVAPGESRTFWAHFTAPPAGVTNVSVEFPGAASFENVRIRP